MNDKLSEIICEAIQDDCIGHCNHPYCYKVNNIVDKLKENKVIITPYSVGDTVYYISGRLAKPARVEEIYYNGYEFALRLVSENNVYFDISAEEVYATKELCEQNIGGNYESC
jgi:hypothetical protein